MFFEPVVVVVLLAVSMTGCRRTAGGTGSPRIGLSCSVVLLLLGLVALVAAVAGTCDFLVVVAAVLTLLVPSLLLLLLYIN